MRHAAVTRTTLPPATGRIPARRALLFVLGSLLAATLTARAQPDPATFPARDAHEGLVIAADPYAEAARARTRFGKKTPLEAGILPIEVALRNDNDKPILVELGSVRLLVPAPGGERQQLEPLEVEDVLERMLYQHGPEITLPRTPLPRRRTQPDRRKEYLDLEAKIRPAALVMTLVPPKTTVRGFLFFHLGRRLDAFADARLYLPDVKFMHNKQPLFFFELPLSAARK